MPKSTVTRLFLGSVIAVIAGVILAFAAVWYAYANGALVLDGPDVVGIEPTASAWTAVVLVVIAVLAMIAGSIGGLVSWIGALINTAQLTDKAWFVILLVLGVWNLGFVAMVAYVIAGPDADDPTSRRGMHAPA